MLQNILYIFANKQKKKEKSYMKFWMDIAAEA